MPSVTIGDVMTLAQQKLGDEAGEIFTTAILLPHVKSAYRDMGRLLKGVGVPQALRVQVIRILANQSSFTPDYGSTLNGFSAPAKVDERVESSSLSISTISGNGTDVITVTTSTVHGLQAGAIVVLIGTGWRWLDGIHSIVSTPTTSSFTVRGTLAVGTANQGTVSISNEQFLPVEILSHIPQWPTTAMTRITQIALNGNSYTFCPATSNRQMRLMFWATADEITSSGDLIGMDDALDFLAVAGGAYAASAKGAQGKAEMLETMAFGPTRNRTKPEGGLALALLNDSVRALQQQQWARPPWRARRVQPGSPYPVS